MKYVYLVSNPQNAWVRQAIVQQAFSVATISPADRGTRVPWCLGTSGLN